MPLEANILVIAAFLGLVLFAAFGRCLGFPFGRADVGRIIQAIFT